MRWGGKSAYSIGENYGVYNDSDSGTLIYEDDNVNIKYHVRGTMLPVHESELFKFEQKQVECCFLKEITYVFPPCPARLAGIKHKRESNPIVLFGSESPACSLARNR